MSIGFQEVLIIVLVILFLFGAKKIPELARSLGSAASEFKKAKNTIKKEAESLAEEAINSAEKENKNEQ